MVRKLSQCWCAFAAIAVLCLAASCSHRATADEKAASESLAGLGGDFTLTDHNGQRFGLQQQRGKVVLLFFGYTFCTEACPVALGKVKQVYHLLGDGQKQVQTIFVSVDPQRDTPAVLKDFLQYFSVGAIGLTGTKDEIDAVVKQYQAHYQIEQSDSAAGYHVSHSTYLYAIDQQGLVKGRFKHTDPPEAIAESVKQLMKSKKD